MGTTTSQNGLYRSMWCSFDKPFKSTYVIQVNATHIVLDVFFVVELSDLT